jgi:hypothetical protein
MQAKAVVSRIDKVPAATLAEKIETKQSEVKTTPDQCQ